jgi:deoxyribodipyrimidine photolyase-like uncharacterized protein
MTIGIWVLGDQLWLEQAALKSCEPKRSNTPVILIESLYYAKQRRYHRQKLVLIWSVMRHFAEELRDRKSPKSLLSEQAGFNQRRGLYSPSVGLARIHARRLPLRG